MSFDNYLPVGLQGAEAADLLTFFMSAYRFYGSDAFSTVLAETACKLTRPHRKFS